jgi:outer membrane protein OmpA-like peptidoglycan-associated protein
MKNLLIITFIAAFAIYSKAQDSIVIYFAFDSYQLDAISLEKLKSVSTDQIESIYGYTDKHGNETYNKLLAQRRIDAVVNQLQIQENNKVAEFPIGEEILYSKTDKANRKVVLQFRNNVTSSNSPKEIRNKESIDFQIKTAKTGDKITLKALNFQPGLDVLLPEAVPTMNELLAVLKKNKNLMIEIQGHICCASEDFGDLSTARAKAVYNFLINNGVSSDRLSYRGFGVSQPIFTIPEKNTEEQISNRRVEIKILSN